ncbi:hypothetical protein IMZ48_08420 [Candidatus Bathyarchaeota archaeon]|nr:hypothetical protein [Candidatus Bathyarchaeota archaeon]
MDFTGPSTGPSFDLDNMDLILPDDPLLAGIPNPLPAKQSPAVGQHVYLNASGKIFRSTRGILTKSPFFCYHLSDAGNVDSSGSIIVHADPDVFESILQYLQHGAYPLFLEADKTHDISRYIACAREARYFHLPRLVEWLEKGRYAEAHRIEYTRRVLTYDEAAGHGGGVTQKVETNGSVVSIPLAETHNVGWGKTMYFVCPRGLVDHRADHKKYDCWKECLGGRANPNWLYEELHHPLGLVLTQTVVIDHSLLRDSSW